MIVLDASAALAGVLPKQSTPASQAFFDSTPATFVAPAIFAFEVLNALLRAERRGLLTAQAVDEAVVQIGDAAELRAWIASPADWVRLFALAREEALSLFDAAYLDLALREGAALASRDAALLEAAGRRGLEIHDLR